MKRTLTTGLTSAMDYLDDDGNLTSDGLWDYTRDADGARQRVDGARRNAACPERSGG